MQTKKIGAILKNITIFKFLKKKTELLINIFISILFRLKKLNVIKKSIEGQNINIFPKNTKKKIQLSITE